MADPFEKAQPLDRRRKPPSDGLTVDLEKGEATFDVAPGEAPAEALERLVRELWADVDAPTLRILNVVEVTFWGDPDKPNKRFKAKVAQGPVADQIDLTELKALVRRARPLKARPQVEAERDLNVVLSDWQIGKAGEKGGGTPELLERVDSQLGQVQDMVRDLRKVGRPVRRINVLKGGDIVDQCFGFGAPGKQLWTNDLSLTDQIDVAVELDVAWHRALSDLADEVRSYAVASNHGQPRMNGQHVTGDADSYDLMIHRLTARVLGENPDRYGNVSLLLPQDPLVAQLDSYGYRIGLAHGHQAGGSGRPVYKLWEWWKGQDFGQQVDVDLMVVGHFHHPYLLSQSNRTLFGAPANDGGSRWLTTRTGEWSPAGTLVFTTTSRGWDDYRILTGGDDR